MIAVDIFSMGIYRSVRSSCKILNSSRLLLNIAILLLRIDMILLVAKRDTLITRFFSWFGEGAITDGVSTRLLLSGLLPMAIAIAELVLLLLAFISVDLLTKHLLLFLLLFY